MPASITRIIKITVQILFCFVLLFLVVFFGSMYVRNYNLEYDEMGRYFDEENSVVFHDQDLIGLGLFTVIFLLLLMMLGWWTWRTLKKPEGE